MISASFNVNSFVKDLRNVVKYSEGFIDGAKDALPVLADQVGAFTVESLKRYLDSNARMSPQAMHHVYEWEQTGSPSARLFDIDYRVAGNGLSFSYTFSQSKSIKSGSKVPFYNKAEIMEKGMPVTIVPKKTVLAFDVDGEQVFTKNPVRIENPGGPEVQGAFERAIDTFFNSYFSQAFLRSSGILKHLETPKEFDKYFPRAKTGGRQAGRKAGSQWVSKTGVSL
jgi:hypothetical protein